jgi:hypothetical protein
METKFLKDALFGGMTSNAFKLGTALTLGWFWPRVNGCAVLYRGLSIEEVDFDNVLAVDKIDASQINPPDYVGHEANTAYFYVVHRVNNCGSEEQSLAAAVKVVIDEDGNLAPAEPNDIFLVKAGQVEGGKVRLIWFYSPLEQRSKPLCFKIYCDGGTGQIDYRDAVAVISYMGRKFYSYQTNALQAGRYLFVVRAKDAEGVDDGSFAEVKVGITAERPAAIGILSAQAV